MNYTARIRAVVASFADQGIDALIVTNLVNIRYLCGFTGSNGVVVVGDSRAVLLTDFRYITMAGEQTEGVEIVQAGRDLVQSVAEIAGELAPDGRVGFEANDVTVARHASIAEALTGSSLVPTRGVVEAVRLIKDADEIALMTEAARIADLAFAACADGIFRGRTERQVAWELEGIMRDGGASGASFDIIVASGERGAMPHAVPADVPVANDTLVTVDLGAIYEGYASDCTRTFATGEPSPELIRAYDVCLEAQERALAAVGPGVRGGDLDAIARGCIGQAGLGEYFGHGLGHGVGLDIHEAPTARPGSTDVLQPGTTITVEPGIYLPGVGGCRIEDLCVVTADGFDVLTGFTKERLTVDC